MSTPSRVGVAASPASSGVSSGGARESTREALLARLGLSAAAAAGSTDAANAGATASRRQAATMECFETPETMDGAEAGQGEQSRRRSEAERAAHADRCNLLTQCLLLLLCAASVSRSDRSLLSSGVGGVSKRATGALGGGGAEDVDTAPVSARLAFHKFAGALYGATAPDGARVYETGSDPMRLTSEAASALSTRFESPFARLQRLRAELADFEEQLREVARDDADNEWRALSQAVSALQQQLSDAIASGPMRTLVGAAESDEKEQTTAAAAAPSAADAGVQHFDSLFAQYVAELSANPSFQPAPLPATPAAASSDAAASAAVPLAKLEQRLASLEKMVGTGAGAGSKAPSMVGFHTATAAAAASSTPSASPALLPAPDLVSALSALHAQLAALQPARIDALQRAVKQLNIEQEAAALAGKGKDDSKNDDTTASASDKAGSAGAASNPSYAAQVSHLYNLSTRWDSLALSLPALVNRLVSVHALHATSASIASRLAAAEGQLAAIDSALSTQREAADAMRSQAEANLKQMADNFRAMETRMEEMRRKMERLGH